MTSGIRENFFLEGVSALSRMDLDTARRHFTAGVKARGCEKSAHYLVYAWLLESRYMDIAPYFRKHPDPRGFALYVRYWMEFLSGEMDMLESTLEKMTCEDNFFLRIYGIYQLHRIRPFTRVADAVAEKTAFSGLSYGTQAEERRAALYLHLLYGRTDLAMRQAEQNLREFPRLTDVYLDWFEVLEWADCPEDLAAALNSPLIGRLANQDHRIYYCLARAARKAGRPETVIQNIKQLLREFKHNAIFYYNLGCAWYARKDMVRALAGYEEAIACAPLFERAHYNAGTIYYRIGHIREAIACFENAVKISRRPDALYNLASSLLEIRDYAGAYYTLGRIRNNGTDREPYRLQKQIREILSAG